MDKLNQKIVTVALGILAYEDAFPEVGFGMLYETAFDKAVKELEQFADVLNVKVDKSKIDKAACLKKIAEVRSHR